MSSVDNIVRIYNDRAEWLATLAYGRKLPTGPEIRAKITEYKGREAVLIEHVDGRETKRTSYR